ncbi:hypothetical protein [Patulibacter sp.]|uniref:hypothetical protein n=1 Tax=Patulibacter sp. TaxID=1912859 RepID=UPI002719B02C|nr:hypothetical protein [Patulibacter sp.]MDO9407647.1 hypothetical protein [Patulibacter sp.]
MSRNTLIQDLRHTIDCMPMHTRVAMLQGVREDTIIVGAYTDSDGGVCPMLSAHRRGGRTTFIQFARTWDRFTKAPKGRSRPAKERELQILTRHLEASIEAESELITATEMGSAIAEHRVLVERREVEEQASAKRARRRERTAVAASPNRIPSWMRPMGSIEEYERAMEEVGRQKVRLGLVGDTAGPVDEQTAPAEERRGTFIAG